MIEWKNDDLINGTTWSCGQYDGFARKRVLQFLTGRTALLRQEFLFYFGTEGFAKTFVKGMMKYDSFGYIKPYNR